MGCLRAAEGTSLNAPFHFILRDDYLIDMQVVVPIDLMDFLPSEP
jgi:hypothetical protein